MSFDSKRNDKRKREGAATKKAMIEDEEDDHVTTASSGGEEDDHDDGADGSGDDDNRSSRSVDSSDRDSDDPHDDDSVGFRGGGGNDDEDWNSEEEGPSTSTSSNKKPRRDDDDDQEDDRSPKSSKTKQPKVHKLSLTKTEDFNDKLRKRGVVYVARIPPRMTPTKIKTLLGEHGEVTRVYLVEEDAAVRRKRRKLHGGNGSKRYVEGWVEFANKSVAKHVATSLNATDITRYKRSPHYGDLWSLKYLSAFKWSHLTEKVAYERRVREQKLRLETMQARRDTVAYKQLVETGQKLDKIQERKRRREEKMNIAAASKGTEDVAGGCGIGARDIKEKKQEKRKDKYKAKQVSQIDADTSQRASKKPLLGSLL